MIFKEKKFFHFLIENFLKHALNEATFCDEFYKAYDLSGNSIRLDQSEELIFADLSKVVDYFSEFETDHKKYPGLYYTKEELAAAILENKSKLQKIHPEYFS